MGRYYNGDIEGKFWFGIQDSRDASYFGGIETLVQDEEGEEEVFASHYLFKKEDLESIQKELDKSIVFLGEIKEKLDQFFAERNSYSDKDLVLYLDLVNESNDIGSAEATILTKAYLMVYARYGLGLKIKACVEETGVCDFVADWY